MDLRMPCAGTTRYSPRMASRGPSNSSKQRDSRAWKVVAPVCEVRSAYSPRCHGPTPGGLARHGSFGGGQLARRNAEDTAVDATGAVSAALAGLRASARGSSSRLATPELQAAAKGV
jgi:hypothetical protein